ncbi:alpha/beta hydrolase [Zunongwangia endophytica]|uniref:Alpha/beta hydrolase n=1 Tax=Zunongwangia endophytica TaxID=1808945 RepID=A0ABV8H8R8_9FLAO|nr:alpha/beta hydrolase [Zunongwangia endophytica]MDN3594882.1 alpha/beta hydrolase [Zunongwangia endophytica]
MYSSSIKNFIVVFVTFVTGVSTSAQQKAEVRPYNITTTVKKYEKKYPFIKGIKPLVSDRFIAEEDIPYKETQTSVLKLDVYYPSEKNDKNCPGVLLIHGGGWISGSKENQRIMAQHLAENGFVAVTASYRLSQEAVYPAGVIDLKDVLRWMRKNAETYKLDPNKIAVLGTSAGAQLATLVGVTPDSELYHEKNEAISSAVQAIVNVDGIVSFVHPEAAAEGEIAGLWLDGGRDENPKNWKEASPLEYVSSNTPPTLFINSSMPRFHAGRDDMIKILEKNNIYSEVHTLDGSPHSFWLLEPWFEPTVDFTVSFLNKIFKN